MTRKTPGQAADWSSVLLEEIPPGELHPPAELTHSISIKTAFVYLTHLLAELFRVKLLAKKQKPPPVLVVGELRAPLGVNDHSLFREVLSLVFQRWSLFDVCVVF